VRQSIALQIPAKQQNFKALFRETFHNSLFGMRFSQIKPIGNVTNRITEPQTARTRGLPRNLRGCGKTRMEQRKHTSGAEQAAEKVPWEGHGFTRALPGRVFPQPVKAVPFKSLSFSAVSKALKNNPKS
jgi:hypothetical protein